MIPISRDSPQYSKTYKNKTGLLSSLEAFQARGSHRIFAFYTVLLLLAVLPPLLIHSETTYQLYGDIASFIWCAFGAAALFYTARRVRPVSKRLSAAWFIIALSLTFFSLGNISWFILTHIYKMDPFPSIADYFYLTSYPLFLIGVLLFPYKKNELIDKVKIYLETITVVISMGLFLWFFVLKPVIGQIEIIDPVQLGFTLAYFSVDTLLFMAFWILISLKSSYLGLSNKLQLIIGLLFLVFADTLFLIKDLQGSYYETVRITDLAYTLSSMLIGMAGLHQIIAPVATAAFNRNNRSYWLSNFHRLFADFLLLSSFYLFVVGHENNALISFKAVSFWVGCLILISITLQRLDGQKIFLLNKDLKKFNSDLEQRVRERTNELVTVNAKLEKAMRAKDEFMAAMSHELRTPLTGILGSAESLAISTYGPLTEKQTKAVTIIAKSGHRLLSLVNDLIDYSRLQSGMIQLFLDRYSLSDICAAALKSVEPDAIQKQQKISLQMYPEKIAFITDVTLAKKMLVHLLKNASKFTPKGGEFGISVIGNVEEQVVEITVWDKGIGINEGDFTEIFTPFVQLDAALARHYEGTGLGLAIVNSLVKLFNGKLDVTSAPGEGSNFIITLPWQASQE